MTEDAEPCLHPMMAFGPLREVACYLVADHPGPHALYVGSSVTWTHTMCGRDHGRPGTMCLRSESHGDLPAE